MSLGSEIAPSLPFLRRYGRFLTGNQIAADRLVRGTLEEIAGDPTIFPRPLGARLGLYRVFHIFAQDSIKDDWIVPDNDLDLLNTFLYKKIIALQYNHRVAFLLAVLEGFSYDEIAQIMGEDHSNVQRMVETSLNTAGDESINSLIENYSDKMPSTAITNGGVSYEELLSLAPIEYAPTARVKQGKLRLAQQSLNLPIVTLDQLEVLRIDHLEEAKLSRIEAGNLSSGFNRRLSSVILLLSEPLTDDSSLRLANQVSALAAMRATIMEELTPISAVNFTSFIDQLVLYCNKFPSWRTFTALESSSATTNEVSSIAATLLNNRNLVVSQDIQDALTEAVETSGDVNKSGQVYFEGLVHNVFSEAGRYILARAKGISSGFNEKLDKEIGEGLAVGLSNLLIAASTPLLALAVQLPATWAWAGPAIAAARVVLGRR